MPIRCPDCNRFATIVVDEDLDFEINVSGSQIELTTTLNGTCQSCGTKLCSSEFTTEVEADVPDSETLDEDEIEISSTVTEYESPRRGVEISGTVVVGSQTLEFGPEKVDLQEFEEF